MKKADLASKVIAAPKVEELYLSLVESTPEFVLNLTRIATNELNQACFQLDSEHPWLDSNAQTLTNIEFANDPAEIKTIPLPGLPSVNLNINFNGDMIVMGDLPHNCEYQIKTCGNLGILKLISDFDIKLHTSGKLTIQDSLISKKQLDVNCAELDNRTGKIYAIEKMKFTLNGRLYNGAPQVVPNHPYNALGITYHSNWYAFNGSFIYCLGPIEINAECLDNSFSTLRSEKKLTLNLTTQLYNLSGEIESVEDGEFNVPDVAVETKTETTYVQIHTRHQLPLKMSIDHQAGPRASIKSGGKVKFNSQRSSNKGGIIFASDAIELPNCNIDNPLILLLLKELPAETGVGDGWVTANNPNNSSIEAMTEQAGLRFAQKLYSRGNPPPYQVVSLDTMQGSIISAHKVEMNPNAGQLGNLNLIAPEVNIRDFATLVHGIIDQSIMLPPIKPFRQEISLAEMPFNHGLYTETKPGEGPCVYVPFIDNSVAELASPPIVYTATNTIDQTHAGLRRLFAECLERRLLTDALITSINHGNVSTENTTPEQVINELRANAVTFGALQQPLMNSERPMLFYRVEEYVGSFGSEMVLAPKLYLPPSLDKPELRSAAGMIEAEVIRILSSNAGSCLLLTSYLDAGKDIKLKANNVDVARRTNLLVQFKQTFIRRKKRLLGGSKGVLTYTRVETFTPAPGGKFTAGGDISIEAKQLHAKGIQMQAGGNIDLTAEHEMLREPIVATRMVSHQTEAKALLEKVTINQDLIRHSVFPTILDAKGFIRVRVENGNLIDIAVQEHAQNVQHEVPLGQLIQEGLVIREEAPMGLKKGAMNVALIGGHQEFAVPQILIADEALKLSADQILLKGIHFAADYISLHSEKGTTVSCQVLNHSIRNKIKGLEGFAYINAASETKFQTAMQPVMRGFKVLEIQAEQGAIEIQAGIIDGVEGARFVAVAKDNNIKFSTVKLQTTTKSERSSIGISFTGSDAILAALKGNWKGAVKALLHEVPFLDPLVNMAEGGHVEDYMAQAMLLGLKLKEANERGKLENPQTVFESITNCFGLQKNPNGDYQWDPAGLNLKLRIGVEKHSSYSTEVIPTILNVWHTVFQAARDIELHSIFIDGKSLLVNAGGKIVIVADEETSSSKEHKAGIAFGLNQGKLAVGADAAKDDHSAKTYKTCALQLSESINLIAQDTIEIKGAVLETAEAFLKATNVLLETMLDEERRRVESIGANMDGNINFNVMNQHNKWAPVQAKIMASQTLYISTNNEIQIKGGVLHVGDNSIPLETSDGRQLYKIAMPRDGDDLFHALGVSRIKAANDLLNNFQNIEIRRFVANDIARLLKAGKLPKIMANKQEVINLLELFTANPEDSTVQAEILNYCTSEEIYREFIALYVALEGSNIEFNVANSQQLGVIDAIAKLYNFRLRVWIRDEEQKLQLSHSFETETTGREIDLFQSIFLVDGQHTTNFSLLNADPMLLLTPVVTHEHLRGFKKGNGFGLNAAGLFELLGNKDGADQDKPRPYVLGTMFRGDQEQANNAAILNEVLGIAKAHAVNPNDGRELDLKSIKNNPDEAQVVGKKHRCGLGFAVPMTGKNVEVPIEEQVVSAIGENESTAIDEQNKITPDVVNVVNTAEQQPNKDEQLKANEILLFNPQPEENINVVHMLRFAEGAGAGMAANAFIFKAANLKYVGTFVRGAGLLGVGVMAVQVGNMAVKFETDNFIFTRDFDRIMNNPLIPADRKQTIWDDAKARQIEARAEAEKVKNLRQRFLDEPEIFGFGLGGFLKFNELPGLGANAFLDLRIRNPFKPVEPKQHLDYLAKELKIFKGLEHKDIANGSIDAFQNFAQARELGRIRANLGQDATAYLSRVGPHKDNVYVGMMSPDQKSLWRLDWDPKYGAHINWKYYYGPNKRDFYSGLINIDKMSQEQYWEIINKFPRIKASIGE